VDGHVREHRRLLAEQGAPQVVMRGHNLFQGVLVLGELADQPVDRGDVTGAGRPDHG
jgi:hypothetical protein